MSTQIPSNYYLNGPQAYQGAYQMPNAQEEELLMQGNSHVFKGVQGMQATNNGEADDGKLGFFDKVGSMIKGAGKAVVNFVSNPVALISSVAIGVACFIPPLNLIAIPLAVAGVVGGACKIGEGLATASQAQTDEQARAAFENVGAGALQTGLSVVGAKAGFSAVKSSGMTNGLSAKSIFHPKESAKTLIANSKAAINKSDALPNVMIKNVYNGVKNGKDLPTKVQGALDGITSSIKQTRLGKAYDNQGTATTMLDKVKNAKDAAKQIAKENAEARAIAKDPDAYVASKKVAAEKKLDDYINTPMKDGKYVKKDGTEMTYAEHRAHINELKTNIETAEAQANAIADGARYGQLAKEAGFKTTKPASSTIDNLAYYNAATGRTNLFKQVTKDYADAATAGGYSPKTGMLPAFGYLTPNANSDEELMNLYYGY